MEQKGFFSADSHVNEPPEAWERIPKNLRSHGPHFVQDPPGLKGLYMVFDGHDPDPVGMTFTAGVEKQDGGIRRVIENFKWEDWRGPWDPSARLGDMDRDGVWAEAIYPSLARNFYTLKGDEEALQKAGLKAYNDWILEYCNAAPKRLLALCLVSALDVPWSIEEMKRCAKLGFKGAALPSALPNGQSYADPVYDPFWTVAQELDFPLHFHVNIPQGRDRSRLKVVTTVQRGHTAIRRNISEPIGLLTDLVFGQVLERYPRLRFVFAEYELSWLHPFLTKMDASLDRSRSESPNAPTLKDLPSECIKRQVYITFQDDRLGVLSAEHLGMTDNYLWASDYPHGGSTWPHSQEIVKAQCQGISDNVQRKLTWGNAAKFYGLE
jgi:uncharacterized protein